GEHERAEERVLVPDRVQFPAEREEQGHLQVTEESHHPPFGLKILVRAYGGPGHETGSIRRRAGAGSPTGRGWPRSVTNSIDGSGVPGAFTNDTNRLSRTGSPSTAAHSSAYPAIWRDSPPATS